MYLRALLLVAASACGLGVGAVDGKRRPYAIYDFQQFSGSRGTYVASTGEHMRRGTRSFLGLNTPSYGVLVGYRRGLAWTHYQAPLDGGRSADYFIIGYLGSLSLGVGSTSESGSLEVPYTSTQRLKGGFSYGGPYLEPGMALLGNETLYVAATCGVIFGTASFTPEGRSGPTEAEVRGYRPGLRLALGGLELGPFLINASVDVRYLVTSDVQVIVGGDNTTPASYGGLSTAFALNFVL